MDFVIAGKSLDVDVRDAGLGHFDRCFVDLGDEKVAFDFDCDRVVACGTFNRERVADDLCLAVSELHYFSHWITPQVMSRRYSTRFFLAEIPEGQQASHCGGELTDSRWITAHDMLEAGRAGEAELHFPTIKTLESIARHKSLGELVDWARSCVEWGVTTMLPAVITRNGEKDIVLPGDRDYPGAKS